MLGRLLLVMGTLILLAQAVLYGARWWRERVPEYHVGDLADATLVTPVEFTVVDAAATERARAKETRRLPPLFRFDPRIGDQAANRFLADFDRRREFFEEGLRRRWPEGLTSDDLDSQTFADFQSAFKMAHPDFPLTDELARNWAAGTIADPLRAHTAAAIREALSRYVVDEVQQERAQGYDEIYLSPPVEAGGVQDAAQLKKLAGRVQTRSLQSVGRTRAKLEEELSATGADWVSYAAGFICANTTFDEALTAAARAADTNGIIVRMNFRPGDELVAAAQPVTQLQAAALQGLRDHYASARAGQAWSRMWPAAFGGVLVLLGALIGRASKGRGHDLVPVSQALTGRSLRGSSPEADGLRRGLLRHLAGWLKLAFVQRLIQQRNEALTSQNDASRQVEMINEKLTRLHPEIRERVAEYERRIAQLERELNGANEVTRELIKTRISLARKELEIEKAKSNLVWN